MPPPTPDWTNQPLKLYHGTVEAHAHSIVHGIDLGRCRSLTDFGRGFYVTTSIVQAETWARNLYDDEAEKGPPVLVEFIVERDELPSLDSLAFVRGDVDAYDFWSLVASCRSGNLPHRRWGFAPTRSAPYDIVVGPVSLRWQTRKVLAEGDQMSFHTDKAVAVLQRRRPRVVPC